MSQNIREAEGPSLRKKIAFGLLLFSFAILNIQTVEAQPSFSRQDRSIRRMGSREACRQSPDVTLTEEQTKALEGLRNGYLAEVLPLRGKLIFYDPKCQLAL